MTEPGRGKQLADAEQVYAAALHYLARREYAESELRQRLLRRGAKPADVDAALARLKQAGYLDDARFAYARVRQRRDISRRGRGMVRAELTGFGIADELIENALVEEYDQSREEETVRALVQREAALIAALDDADKRRKRLQSLERRLLTRGFRPATVFAAIRQAADDILGD